MAHQCVGLRNHHNGEVLVYHTASADRHVKSIHSPVGIPVRDYSYKCSFTIESQGGDKVALRSFWPGVYLAVIDNKMVLTNDCTPARRRECIFQLDKKPNSHVALKGYNGKYISLQNGVPELKHVGPHFEIWFEALPSNGSM